MAWRGSVFGETKLIAICDMYDPDTGWRSGGIILTMTVTMLFDDNNDVVLFYCY